MSLLDRIRDANRFDLHDLAPFVVDGVRVGLARADFVDRLSAYPDVFSVGEQLTINERLATPEARTSAVAGVLHDLKKQGLISGWRDELYPVGLNFEDEPLLAVERAAATLFGFRNYAVNLNGYVRTDNGLSIWLQHRAKTKPMAPDKLDVLVSGGQPAGTDLFENLVKESGEEAGIEERLARKAQPAGTVSFCASRDYGVYHGHYFNYDLELPPGFTPENQDGEVQAFYLWPAHKVIEVLSDTADFAFDSAVVVIDFLVRHGHIGRDTPDYDAICRGLRP